MQKDYLGLSRNPMESSQLSNGKIRSEEQQIYGKGKLNKQTKIQINSQSIVSSYQLVLITILVFCSLVNIKLQGISYHSHIKNLRDNFNKAILGNDWLGLYDQGNNINQNMLQLVDYSQMQKHFSDMIDSLRNFTDFDGFPQFQNRSKKNVFVLIQFSNKKLQQQIWDLDELQLFFKYKIHLRQFLLNVKHMKLRIVLGDNKLIRDFQLSISYVIHAKSMLQVQLQLHFKQNTDYYLNKRAFNVRTLQQIFAFLLLTTYLFKLNQLLYKNKNENLKAFQSINADQMGSIASQTWIQKRKKLKNTAVWCFSLVFLNLVTIVSWKLAPICSLLQLLPIFQSNPTLGKQQNQYSFNQNLRYALPIVMRVFIPVFIFLNGFIMYSLLMWPGDYFDNYLQGFFSYFYNNFQVGTYQIFIELKQRGNFAYMIYLVLYFYMILVGNNIYPALFCTLIQMAVTERQMEHFIRDKIHQSKCPNCSESAVSDDREFMMDINISSPKLSPYMRPTMKSPTIQSKERYQRKIQIQIQQEVQYKTHQQLTKFKTEKFLMMSKKLKQIALRQGKQNAKWKRQQIQKIEALALSIGNYD